MREGEREDSVSFESDAGLSCRRILELSVERSRALDRRILGGRDSMKETG